MPSRAIAFALSLRIAASSSHAFQPLDSALFSKCLSARVPGSSPCWNRSTHALKACSSLLVSPATVRAYLLYRSRRSSANSIHVVSAALVSWPLTLAPFFLRGATGDGLLLGALGCVGSAGVALFYEEPRGGWED